MSVKGQGLGKEREWSLQDVRDVVGLTTKKYRTWWFFGERVEGGTGGLAGRKRNPSQAKPPKRVREASHLILKNSVNSAKEWLSLITEQAASCILSRQFHTTDPSPPHPLQI